MKNKYRENYIEEIRTASGIQSDRIIQAFSQVPREHFLDPGPWLIAHPFDQNQPYQQTSDDSLKHIYKDVGIAIDPKRNLNNERFNQKAHAPELIR